MTPPRVVLDTNVLVAGSRCALGASYQLLRAVRERLIVPLVSVPLAFEYEEVLTRPDVLAATGQSRASVGSFLDAFLSVSEFVDASFLWRPSTRDANDDMVLEAAVNAAADALVTFNVSDFELAARRFGLVLLVPRDLVVTLRRPHG